LTSSCFLQYVTASSNALWATPSANDATIGRAMSSVFMAIFMPSPSLPSKWSFGIRQFFSSNSTVLELRIPSLFSTINALRPLTPLLGSVEAKITMISAMPQVVAKHLVPLSTHSFPSALAIVATAPASDPAPGSVSAKPPIFPATIRLKYSCFCSCVPAINSG